MEHLPDQVIHLVVPLPFRFVFLTPDQVSAVMLDTFLMSFPIIIKCQVVVMDNKPHVILQRRPFDPFVSFLFPSDIQCHALGRRCQHKDLSPFSIHTCIGEICIHDRGSHQPADDLFLLRLCFL